MLVRMGHCVGYRRVARLMKAANLSASVKRLCQTTTFSEGMPPWGNRLKALEVSRCDQVWVGDITYVNLKAHEEHKGRIEKVFSFEEIKPKKANDKIFHLRVVKKGIDLTQEAERDTVFRWLRENFEKLYWVLRVHDTFRWDPAASTENLEG